MGDVIDQRRDVDRTQWPRAIAELSIANYVHLARTWTGPAVRAAGEATRSR